MIQTTLIKKLTKLFPNAEYSITTHSNVVVKNVKENDVKTVQYGFYFYPDGLRIRRMVEPYFPAPIGRNEYYQLNRNSHTNEWPAFANCNEAVDWFAHYIANYR